MDGFDVTPVEGLRSPVVIMAFTGWSDTGTVTTDVAQRLITAYNAQRFVTVDPEDYYVFTDTRPSVRLDVNAVRELRWPENAMHYARLEDAAHDIVIVHGVEPNLRWRTFGERISEAIAGCNPSLVCTLVARPAATPHTRPVPVTGSSADPRLAAKFGLGRSLYQGPTGILGVIHDILRRKYNAPLISLAAGVPHYLNTDENPPATLALLRALEPVIGLPPPLGDLEEEGARFVERVEEASRGDEQIAAYVRTLEEHYGEVEEEEDDAGGGGDLPSADDILRDVEDFLRGQGEGEGGGE